jgi:hypothetical protein
VKSGIPVPDSSVLWSESGTTAVSVPVCTPTCEASWVGEKVTVTTQVPSAGTGLAQPVVLTEKPLVICSMGRGWGPLALLVSVTVCEELSPTATEPKLSEPGESEKPGAPVPFREAVCEKPPETTESVPVRAPIADGVKPTAIVQLAPPAMIMLEQVSVPAMMLKSLPVMLTDETAIGPLELLIQVKSFNVSGMPTASEPKS